MDGENWLHVVNELRTITAAGLTHATDPYDLDRYHQLADLAVTIVAKSLTLNHEAVKADLFPGGYVTPRIDIRAAVTDNGKLLLVQQTDDNRWALPGGWADLGSKPSEMAVREAHEETGAVVRPTHILGIHTEDRDGPLALTSVYKITIACELVEAAPPSWTPPSHEILQCGWFSENNIPALSTQRTSTRLVRCVFDDLRTPATPTAFD